MGDEVVRHAFPVAVEVDGDRSQEGEPGTVRRLLTALKQRRVERPAELVGGEVVDAGVAHDRRRAHRVEDALHHRPHALAHRSATPWDARVDGAGEVEQVSALGVVEL